jgi:hypothetical protein
MPGCPSPENVPCRAPQRPGSDRCLAPCRRQVDYETAVPLVTVSTPYGLDVLAGLIFLSIWKGWRSCLSWSGGGFGGDIIGHAQRQLH